uniref:Uncharacterized protein n=1 Tax=Panagrolaimus davidi TaxID=227884 RepID=A0A914PWV2_9BILA
MRFLDFTSLDKEYFHYYGFITKQSFTKFSNNLWLTYLLAIDNANSMFYSKLMSKIVRCEIRTLSIHGSENLKFEDFVFLTESGEVKYLDLKNTKVVKSDNSVVPIEEIFGQVLKVTYIVLDPCHVTKDTMKVLLSQKRENKFTDFRLENIDKLLDAKMLIDFINVC